MKDSSQVRITFSSSYGFIEAVHNVAEMMFVEAGFSSDDIYWMTLAVREGVTNAVKHGNREDIGKEVSITLIRDGKKLTISITDQGKGFDIQSIPDPTKPENLLKNKGRGIYYIRTFMDDVIYRYDEGIGSTLTMIKNL